MPQVFRVGGYLVFIWYAESNPLEPVHVHVCEGVPSENATKIWITKEHRTLLCHNKSNIVFPPSPPHSDNPSKEDSLWDSKRFVCMGSA